MYVLAERSQRMFGRCLAPYIFQSLISPHLTVHSTESTHSVCAKKGQPWTNKNKDESILCAETKGVKSMEIYTLWVYWIVLYFSSSFLTFQVYSCVWCCYDLMHSASMMPTIRKYCYFESCCRSRRRATDPTTPLHATSSIHRHYYYCYSHTIFKYAIKNETLFFLRSLLVLSFVRKQRRGTGKTVVSLHNTHTLRVLS